LYLELSSNRIETITTQSACHFDGESRIMWPKLSLFMLISYFLMAPIAAQEIPEIHRLYIEDQQDRGAIPRNENSNRDVSPEQMEANDLARRKRVHELMAAGKLNTGPDFHDAAFIYQHGDDPDDYLLAHVLAMTAVEKGDLSSRWIAAATLDRYLQAVGQPQVFGTQYLDPDYLEFFHLAYRQRHAAQSGTKKTQGQTPEIKNKTTNTKRIPAPTAKKAALKKQDGYTQAPYNSGLIPDALRANYCVIEIKQQQEKLAALNSKKLSCRTRLKAARNNPDRRVKQTTLQNLLSNWAKAFSSVHCSRALSLASRKCEQLADVLDEAGLSERQADASRALDESFQRLSPDKKLYSRLARANFFKS
jgi:hypothetical protein